MPKRYVLIHDCGYVVPVGTALKFSENPERVAGILGTDFEGEWVYLGCGRSKVLVPSDTIEGSGSVVVQRVVGPSDPEYKGRSFYAIRFDCTVQEIDDDC